MADRYLPAFLKACVSDASEEITALENLLWQRLLTAGFTINSSGQIGTSVPLTIAVDPANLSTVVPVVKGGTALATGTSGGVLGFTASGTIASSVALTANALVLGGGAGATPTPMGSLGTTTTVLHGNAAGAPTFGAVSLTADVSGILPTANGGTGIAFFTAAGPTVARIFTFPDAAATVLTSNAAVTVAQGGTGLGTLTANNVILGNGTSTPAFVAPSTSGNLLTSNGTTWQSTALTQTWTRLTASADSGTDTSAGAANVATVALASGLTAKDSLVIFWTINETTAAVATPQFYNSTDSTQILDLTAGVGSFAGGHRVSGTTWMQQDQAGGTTIDTHQIAYDGSGTGNFVYGQSSTFTTAWTGAWTLAFRHAGVTATGTFKWTWKVYKVVGQ